MFIWKEWHILFCCICTVVNASLPIDITATQVQHYPELAKLLTDLSQKITPEGVSVQVKQELHQVSEAV